MRFLEQSPTATTNQFSLDIVLVLDQVVTRWGNLLFSIWGQPQTETRSTLNDGPQQTEGTRTRLGAGCGESDLEYEE